MGKSSKGNRDVRRQRVLNRMTEQVEYHRMCLDSLNKTWMSPDRRETHRLRQVQKINEYLQEQERLRFLWKLS